MSGNDFAPGPADPLVPPLTRQELRELPGLRFDTIGGAMRLVAAAALTCAFLASWTGIGFVIGITLALVTPWFVVLVQGTRRRGLVVDSVRAFGLFIWSIPLAIASLAAGGIAFMGTCTATLFAIPGQGYEFVGLSLSAGVVGALLGILLSFRGLMRLLTVRPPASASAQLTNPAGAETESEPLGESPQ